jgi:anti-sigma B factor antagonist
MSYKEKDIDGVTILTVERKVKGALEARLKDRIDELVRAGRLQIVVDLKEVPYFDSSDIGRIIRAHLSARRAGARVRLCSLSERIMEALKLTRLDTILEIYQDEQEAMAAILRERATP